MRNALSTLATARPSDWLACIIGSAAIVAVIEAQWIAGAVAGVLS